MDTLYVVMPAYNEAENIKKVIGDWYPVLEKAGEDSRLVVADMGSSDDTHEILAGMQQDFPKLMTLDTRYKEHGPKLLALYKYAIESGADYVFQTDSDGQTDPQEFYDFWDRRHEADAIIGNRTVRGDGHGRKVIEGVVVTLLRLYFHVRVPDANAPFRLMRSEMLKKYLERMPEDYYLPNIMLTTYFAYYGERLLFKEISFAPRLKGENSIDYVSITKIGMRALKEFHDFKKDL